MMLLVLRSERLVLVLLLAFRNSSRVGRLGAGPMSTGSSRSRGIWGIWGRIRMGIRRVFKIGTMCLSLGCLIVGVV